jgi:hypothetical protein
MTDLKHYAAVKNWDLDYFKKYGSFKFLRLEDLEGAHPNT